MAPNLKMLWLEDLYDWSVDLCGHPRLQVIDLKSEEQVQLKNFDSGQIEMIDEGGPHLLTWLCKSFMMKIELIYKILKDYWVKKKVRAN